jgi:hypothetical protein
MPAASNQRARARINASDLARVRYEERGVHLRAVLEMQDQRTGRWVPVGDAVVSYPNVQRAVALEHGRPDLLPENAPHVLTEVGWFGSKFVRKVKKTAKKVARSKIGKVAKGIAGAYMSVQSLAAKAMAKSGIPIAAQAGQAYLKVVAPVAEKLLGKHAAPWEALAEKARKRLPSAPANERPRLEQVIKVSAVKAAKGRKLAEDVATKIARMPLERAREASQKAVHRADAFEVRTPAGNIIYVKP